MKKLSAFFICMLLMLTAPASADIPIAREEVVIKELSQMFQACTAYLFKQQPLINQKGGDKSALFGRTFVNNVKKTYVQKFNKEFIEDNHLYKTMLVRVMIEVMEDNRTLINDEDLGFKGFIPAVFGFQLTQKLSTKGLGVKIKFTTSTDKLRNKLNAPDRWESSVIKLIQRQKLTSYLEENTTFRGKRASRYFVPLKMEPFCLNCHGSPEHSPLNRGKDKSEWSNIDMTGFPMERWELDDFGGGISVTIYDRDI